MSSGIGKALKNSAWQSLSGLSVTGLNFVQMLVLARVLGPAGFGSFVTSQAQVLVWMLLVDLGLTSGLIAALTEFEGHGRQSTTPLVRAALGIRLAGAALGGLVVFGLALQALRSGAIDQARFWQDIAYTPFLFSWACQQTAVSVALFRGRQGLSMLAVLAGSLFSVGLSIGLVLRGDSLSTILFVQSFWGFLVALAIFFGISESRNAPARQASAEIWPLLWKNSWPYAVVFAAMTAWGRVDQIATTHILGLEAGGQYGLAARLVAIPVLLAASVAFATFPDLQRLGRDAPEKLPLYTGAVLKLLFRYGLPASFLGLGGVALVILPLVPKFHSALYLLPWFAPGVWAYWLHSFAINAFWGARRYREIVLAHAQALAVYLLVIVPLVKVGGNQGAALAYDAFGLVLLFSAARYMRRLGVLNPGFRFLGTLSPEERAIWEKVREKFAQKTGRLGGGRNA